MAFNSRAAPVFMLRLPTIFNSTTYTIYIHAVPTQVDKNARLIS